MSLVFQEIITLKFSHCLFMFFQVLHEQAQAVPFFFPLQSESLQELASPNFNCFFRLLARVLKILHCARIGVALAQLHRAAPSMGLSGHRLSRSGSTAAVCLHWLLSPRRRQEGLRNL